MQLPVVMPGFAAAKHYVDQPLGATSWIEITQQRIDQFARATGDDRWIHSDPERSALESPWKTGATQGYLLLSLTPDLLPQLVVLVGWSRAINTAVENCSFSGAVPAGGRVRMHATLERARAVPGGGLRLSFGIQFESEGVDEPACRARVHYIYFA